MLSYRSERIERKSMWFLESKIKNIQERYEERIDLGKDEEYLQGFYVMYQEDEKHAISL